MGHKIKIVLFGWLVLFASCKAKDKGLKEWKASDGYVPDSLTAIKLARIMFVRIYGDKVLDKEPFKAVLKDNKVWIIDGTLEAGIDGGVPHLELQKSDGKVVNLYHSK